MPALKPPPTVPMIWLMSSLDRVSLGMLTDDRDPRLVDAIRSGLSQDVPLAALPAVVPAAGPVCLL
jgi:hypothetical protein